MYPLPELNLYTSTVNIATSLVKPCKIIFFKLLPNNGKGFWFRVVSRISLWTLFYHLLHYSLKVHSSVNLLLWGILFLSPYNDEVAKKKIRPVPKMITSCKKEQSLECCSSSLLDNSKWNVSPPFSKIRVSTSSSLFLNLWWILNEN